jgi:hypothetical protein
MSQGLESAGVEGRKCRRQYTGKIEQAVHLASWERSGLSGGEYARLHGLNARDLYRWRKLERAGEAKRNARANGSGFMTIDVDGRAFGGSGDGGLRMVLRRGSLEVEVSGGGSADELVRLAGALRREVLDA